MIREANENDYGGIDEMQFGLQKYFSEIDQSRKSLPYQSINDTHRYMQKMIDDSIRLLVLSDNDNAVNFNKKSGFIPHDLEMVMKI